MEDQDAPATKRDVAAVKQEIEQLRSEVNHGYRELAERLDDGITRMMNAFSALPRRTASASPNSTTARR